MGLVNFARGAIFMVGTYFGVTFYMGLLGLFRFHTRSPWRSAFCSPRCSAPCWSGSSGGSPNLDLSFMLLGTIGVGIVLANTAALIWGTEGVACACAGERAADQYRRRDHPAADGADHRYGRHPDGRAAVSADAHAAEQGHSAQRRRTARSLRPWACRSTSQRAELRDRRRLAPPPQAFWPRRCSMSTRRSARSWASRALRRRSWAALATCLARSSAACCSARSRRWDAVYLVAVQGWFRPSCSPCS